MNALELESSWSLEVSVHTILAAPADQGITEFEVTDSSVQI
jgi:hypothetical protein